MARSHRVVLTDRYVMQKSLKVGDHLDALVPAFGMHVTENDYRSYVMVGRFPTRPRNPTRRKIAQCGTMTLADARDEARRWHALLREGVDPKTDRARRRAELQAQQVNTFGFVAEQFLQEHCKGLVHYVVYKRLVEGKFTKAFGADRVISTITPAECASLIDGIKERSGEAQAHNSLSLLRGLFSWTVGKHKFGLERSPCVELRPAGLIGKLKARSRVLTDDELRSIWRATEGDHPYDGLIRLLLLTGARLREIADLSWGEIDLDKKLIVIPPERMKGVKGRKKEHVIPITPMGARLLENLPRPVYKKGDFVFSVNKGLKSYSGFGKAKTKLNAASGVGLGEKDSWVVHDIRRTMRSHLSALDIPDRVREVMIAHAQPGMHAIYDKYTYEKETRRGFELWEQRLASIINPQQPPAEVVDLDSARGKQRRRA